MNRKIFFEELAYWLAPLPEYERNEIMADYQEHFDIGQVEGKSEQEIIASLGQPKDLAELYIKDKVANEPRQSINYDGYIPSAGRKKDSLIYGILLGVGLLIFGPIIFIALPAIIFAFGVVAVVVPTSFLFAGVVTVVTALFSVFTIHPLASLMTGSTGIALISGAGLLYVAFYYGIKVLWKYGSRGVRRIKGYFGVRGGGR